LGKEKEKEKGFQGCRVQVGRPAWLGPKAIGSAWQVSSIFSTGLGWLLLVHGPKEWAALNLPSLLFFSSD